MVLTIAAKLSILDVCIGLGYTFVLMFFFAWDNQKEFNFFTSDHQSSTNVKFTEN